MATKKLHWCVIKAPTAKDASEVARHLTYWSFVKAFRMDDERTIRVWMSLGRMRGGKKRLGYLYYVHDIIQLCFNDKGLEISRWHLDRGRETKILDEKAFLRPEEMVEPFSDIIGRNEMDSGENSFQAMLFNYLDEEKKEEMREILGVLKKEAQEELCCALLDYLEQGMTVPPTEFVLHSVFNYWVQRNQSLVNH